MPQERQETIKANASLSISSFKSTLLVICGRGGNKYGISDVCSKARIHFYFLSEEGRLYTKSGEASYLDSPTTYQL